MLRGRCLFFDEYNNTQPDILFIREERAFIVTRDGIEGQPDLIVEVISPSSIKNDRVTKKDLYLKFGVMEYWLIDPIYQTVEIYALEQDKYVLKFMLVESGEVASQVLEGFKIDIKAIFQNKKGSTI